MLLFIEKNRLNSKCTFYLNFLKRVVKFKQLNKITAYEKYTVLSKPSLIYSNHLFCKNNYDLKLIF